MLESFFVTDKTEENLDFNCILDKHTHKEKTYIISQDFHA